MPPSLSQWLTSSRTSSLRRRRTPVSLGTSAGYEAESDAQRRKTRSLRRRLAVFVPVLGVLIFVAWPLPAGLLDAEGTLSVRVLDRDGQLLRELPSRRASRSVALPPEAPVPQVLRDAFIASEDRRFEWHPGVDPLAMARAAAGNLKAGRVVSGASPLTQQLARLLV